MSVISILDRFKTSYMNFIDELISQFPNEPNLIIGRVFFNDQIPVEHVAETFISRILPYKNKIDKRDDSFFIENNHIFGMLAQNKSDEIIHFKKLWISDRLDDDDRNVIWKWFDIFCILMEKYQTAKKDQ